MENTFSKAITPGKDEKRGSFSKEHILSAMSVERSFRLMRNITVLSVVFSSLTVLLTSLYCMFKTEEKYDRIFVLDEGHALWLSRRESALESRPTEAKAHLRLFHEMFFTLSPDRESWDESLLRALEMGSKSVQTLYEDLRESHFYERLRDTRAQQRITVDSIILREGSHPIEARCFCRQSILRESVEELRLLYTECTLTECPRTYSNPHGFLVENFRITRNSFLSRKRR